MGTSREILLCRIAVIIMVYDWNGTIGFQKEEMIETKEEFTFSLPSRDVVFGTVGRGVLVQKFEEEIGPAYVFVAVVLGNPLYVAACHHSPGMFLGIDSPG